ncbi:glycogen/starch/alpha-glucan phosphorylase [Pasteurellaceae bacterium LIM206]|nr:glycogen/starch/alpha-glucan phosphorylase [Pasteurellaceae bacterium LIM206]
MYNINIPEGTFKALEKSVEDFKQTILYKLIFLIGRTPEEATKRDWFNATLLTVRDIVTEARLTFLNERQERNVRRVYYLSMEFLIGRTLSNALLSTHTYDLIKQALASFNLNLEDLLEKEVDPGLGNGGLGRLAACFLDSLATLDLPSVGYGIHYEYGMFQQKIINGEQVEKPDAWLEKWAPWEFVRPTKRYEIKFGGTVAHESGRAIWRTNERIKAVAFDQFIPGYNTNNSSMLRLWTAHSASEFDLNEFNKGDYFSAMEERSSSENVSRVLYPNDSTYNGRELRLRQEYFLVSASIQDILRRYKDKNNDINNLADKIAIHLNDTHPALAIPELMRILVDKERIDWDRAWGMCILIFSYTCHTLMAEALETWPVELFEKVLPRHLEIIYEINERFLSNVRSYISDDEDFIRRVSLIDERNEKSVRMGWLCVVGSHKINGVAEIHSKLMTTSTFADFAKIYPNRFTNVTNGVTPRRWIAVANPQLAQLLTKKLGKEWLSNLTRLEDLKKFINDGDVRSEIHRIKHDNKVKLANYIGKYLNIQVNPNALFDVQIKRIHEYKRQIMNVLHIISLYNRMIREPEKDWVPRVFILAGKAASSYVVAKQTIHLINDVARVINNDDRLNDRLKVVFIPNYSVSLAELIIPAADISEQISLAGTEASGTSNMKFALNGALTVGTLDGANVEILSRVGEENIFIFGHTVEEVTALRNNGYNPQDYYNNNEELKNVINHVYSGRFSPREVTRYHDLMDNLTRYDYYQALADYQSYLEIHEKIAEKYRNKDSWVKSSIYNIASMGYFSSDRAIEEYANKIWHLEPFK